MQGRQKQEIGEEKGEEEGAEKESDDRRGDRGEEQQWKGGRWGWATVNTRPQSEARTRQNLHHLIAVMTQGLSLLTLSNAAPPAFCFETESHCVALTELEFTL